jgi:hypothetical protein
MIRILSFHLHFTTKCLYYCYVAVSVCRPDTLPEVLWQSQSADQIPFLKFRSSLNVQTRYPAWSFAAISACRPDTLAEVMQQSVCRPDTLSEVFSNLSLQARYPVWSFVAISVCRPDTLPEFFHEFCQSHHANSQTASSHLAANSSVVCHPNLCCWKNNRLRLFTNSNLWKISVGLRWSKRGLEKIL